MYFSHAKEKTFTQQILLAFVLLLTFSEYTSAISGNSEQPIHIKADSAELNEANGTAIYQGDVSVTQGSAILKADQVIIHSKDQSLSKIVATGTPASLTQKPEADKPATQAFGNTITYSHEEETIKLQDNAKLIQGNNQFQGKTITYNSRTRIVSASGSGQDNQADGRVELIIHPKALKQESDRTEESDKQ